MANFNKVILIGNVTRDPELKYTPKGNAVTEIGLAVNRTYTIDGEKREETTFVDVTFWGRSAEIAVEYLKKGRPLFVEGRLQLDSWEDKQSGQKRSRLRVIGETLQFLDSREGREASGTAQKRRTSESAPPASEPPGDFNNEDDNIPF